MADSDRVERFWSARLRWRMRGAWQWPAFMVLTPAAGALLTLQPPYEGTPEGVLGGVLLVGFANIFIVAVLAPLVGRLLRRRRRDVPKAVAADYAGTALLCALAALVLVAGLLHRPAVAAEEAALAAAYDATRDYVAAQAPEYLPGLERVDALRLAEDAYRICVPGREPDRHLCLYVDTDQHPAGVRRDGSMEPNSALRVVGGFH